MGNASLRRTDLRIIWKKLKDYRFYNAARNSRRKKLDFFPKTFDDYLGQKELKKKLAVYTQAAKMRNEPLDHLLLFGPPGLGKTTLSQIMAHVMDVSIKICSGPMMERTGDLVAILSSLEPRDILFIDEIHRMPTHVEEVFYTMRWNIFGLTSLLAKAQAQNRSIYRSVPLRLSAQPPKVV